MRRRAAALALAMSAGLGPPAPASAEPVHVVTMHFELEYSPVLGVTGCRWPSRIAGHGVVAATFGVWLTVTFDTVQDICAHPGADQFCAVLTGGPEGFFCVSRTWALASVSGTLTVGDTHEVFLGTLAWVPTSLPVATATMTGTLVLL